MWTSGGCSRESPLGGKNIGESFWLILWLASSGIRNERAGIDENPEDHDEERMGTRRPDTGGVSFGHGLALAEAGHDVQIFLLAEATSLMGKTMVNAILPVGWPPLSETLNNLVAKRIPIFA